MKQMICIVCPVGCKLQVSENLIVRGNQCKRGELYAKQEIMDPRRMLTTTIQTNSKTNPRVSVKTNLPLPKDKIFECMTILGSISLSKNVKIGDIILSNILNTGVDIIATKDFNL